ncbi:flagellar assembly protein H [Buttiauxella warmboldiae]|uniref:Flagellar assembly protein FliH n=1 Tax=Buttiauxella warmboldiae TaxID=82993 RepID=A0A3N5DL06_9ENTR|nr:flagellar assembly protein FliH [Buttiauxella warmboldiae]RPH29464.1 flagellar assembly protein H [Buttiauxella warmboldiae]
MSQQTKSRFAKPLTSAATPRPRVHKFPPLHRSRHLLDATAGENGFAAPFLDNASLQQQLADGFQEGMKQGFEQGLEEGRGEGYQEGVRLGFDEGMRKGHDEGKLAGHQLFMDAAQPLDSITEQIKEYLADYESRRRNELLQLVEKVTRQVIRCELTLHPTQLLTLVEEALTSLAKTPSQLKVSLNPEEFRRISEAEPERAKEWGLCADPQMLPGECRVVTETTEMDIGCEHRMQQCMDVLKETLLPETQDA